MHLYTTVLGDAAGDALSLCNVRRPQGSIDPGTGHRIHDLYTPPEPAGHQSIDPDLPVSAIHHVRPGFMIYDLLLVQPYKPRRSPTSSAALMAAVWCFLSGHQAQHSVLSVSGHSWHCGSVTSQTMLEPADRMIILDKQRAPEMKNM